MPGTLIVALDMGTSNIRALVGEAHENGGPMIIGMGEEPSCGIRKGEIIDFDNALASLKAALHKAEEQADVSIRSAYLLLTGGHITSFTNRGTIPIMSNTREISRSHIDEVGEVARRTNLKEDREVIHTVNQRYSVDDQDNVVNPAGMEGAHLGLQVTIIHGAANRIRNNIKVISSVPLSVEDVAFSGLCSSLAVLTPQQKESGVLLIDMGGGTTDILLYAPRYLAFAHTLGVGGEHVTNDVAIGLKLPASQAERLKIDRGSAIADHSVRGKSVSLPAEGGFSGRTVKLMDLNTIINARMEETFNAVKHLCDRDDLLHQLGGGVVLTGGVAEMKDIDKLAEGIFNMPVSIGRPRNISGLDELAETPQYAAITGMLRYGLMSEKRKNTSGFAGFMKRILGGALET